MELNWYYGVLMLMLMWMSVTLVYSIGKYKGFKEAKEFYNVTPGCGK
jgi:hypothetical protein